VPLITSVLIDTLLPSHDVLIRLPSGDVVTSQPFDIIDQIVAFLTSLMSILFVILALNLWIFGSKARFITALYRSVVHQSSGWSGYCVASRMKLPIPHWMESGLPVLFRNRVLRAYYGRPLYDALFELLRRHESSLTRTQSQWWTAVRDDIYGPAGLNYLAITGQATQPPSARSR
jgi:hypothetical protein